MSYDATNITKFYERKLVQKLLATNRETANIFSRYIRRVTPIIQQYRYNPNGVVIRDPALERAIKAEAQRLATELQQYIRMNQTESWMMAEEKTNHMIEEWVNQTAAMKAQSGEIVTKTGEILQTGGIHQRNVQAMEAFMARKTAGMNLSDAVWDLADRTRKQLEFYLESGLSVGRSADVISRDIRNILNQPDKRFRRVRDPKTGKLVPSTPMKNYHPGRGVYRSSYMNARRLARTEITMAYRQSDMTAFRNLDMVLGYEVKLSAAHPVADICDSMKGRYPKEFTWNLWHVQCLCYCVPVLMTPEQFDAWNAGDPVDAKYINDMPAEAKQYLVAHRDQFDRWKQQPYFIQQNEKLIQKAYAGSPVVQPKVVSSIAGIEQPVAKGFIPANSIEEAKQWAEQNGIAKTVNINTDVTLEEINTINSELFRLKNGYKKYEMVLEELNYSKATGFDLGEVSGGYGIGQTRMTIYPENARWTYSRKKTMQDGIMEKITNTEDLIKHREELEDFIEVKRLKNLLNEYKKEYEISPKYWGASEYANSYSESLRMSVRHEYAHFIDRNHDLYEKINIISDDLRKQIADRFYEVKGNKQLLKKYYTGYSESKYHEFWAEAMSLYESGMLNDDIMIKILEEIKYGKASL